MQYSVGWKPPSGNLGRGAGADVRPGALALSYLDRTVNKEGLRTIFPLGSEDRSEQSIRGFAGTSHGCVVVCRLEMQS